MNSCHLLRPQALWLIPLLLLLLWLISRRRAKAGNWQQVCDATLLPFILQGQTVKQQRLPLLLIALAGILTIFSLSGPSCERIEQPVFRDQSALVIALDLSSSMDATDISPSRLARARLKLIDILQQRKEGQTALIVYAANAFTVSPLTDDTNTIISLVGSLESEMMPQQGSRPDAAIAKASALLQQAGIQRGDILLITDGIQDRQLQPTLTQLANQQHRLSVLSVGTASGAPIKLKRGGFLQDSQGSIVIPKLDEAPLQRLAQQGGGRYHTMTTDDSDLQYLMSGFSQQINRQSLEQKNFNVDQWRELGPWLLLPVLLLAAFAFRRGYLLLLLFTLTPLSHDAYAAEWSDLFLNRDQQGKRWLQQGDAAKAAQTFNSPEWQAAAQYRAGNYAQAAKLLEGINSADAQYNRGNALAKLNQFDQAIKAYDQALALDPQHEDAKYNRELLKQQQQKSSQSQDNQQQQADNSSDQQQNSAQQPQQNGDPQPGEQAQQQQGEQQSDSAQPAKEADANTPEPEQQDNTQQAQRAEQSTPKDGEKSEQSTELRETSENEIATEQWLRRIPDDPGGLLRRKFRYQYQTQQPEQQQEQEPW